MRKGGHGPKKRKQIIDEEMRKLLASDFMDEWRSSAHMSEKLKNSYSSFWSPLSPYVIGARMKRYEKEYNLERARKFHEEKAGRNYWRRKRI